MLFKKEKHKDNVQKDGGYSELRQDLVTGDWVVIADNRGKRPNKKKIFEPAWSTKDVPKEKDCLFCDPKKTKQEPDVLIYEDSEGEWTTRVFPNKYPAFKPLLKNKRVKHLEEGPYFLMDGVGYHELIVTRDHNRQLGQMETEEVAEVLDAYQTRYLELMNKKFVRYIEVFHNYGKAAGGSIYHPHSQLMAIPVVSPYVNSELKGAERYKKERKECVYCAMLEEEQKVGKRIVFENDDFIAFCPFAARRAYEVWVVPKKHKSYFERMTDRDKMAAAEVLKEALRRIGVRLNWTAYNFYLHTAPCDGKDYHSFHWHFEILPKTSIWAGFELSTGIEINAVSPEKAADELRAIGG
jgi:UDPglucose--hexose-1-phosphate uridylyltransferase